jgi:Leucine-rich repeat (LRR) protein
MSVASCCTSTSEEPRTESYAQRRSSRPQRGIPADIVQNIAEYLGRVTSLLSFRGVSHAWMSAVSDAVGFLNSRCWTALVRDEGAPLWTSLRLDTAAIVTRCAVLCLRTRLETLHQWPHHAPNPERFRLPLQLLGEGNMTLTALSVSCAHTDVTLLQRLQGVKILRLQAPGPGKVLSASPMTAIGALRALEVLDLTELPICELGALHGCVSLRELILANTLVTNESFAGLEGLLSRLHKLDLSGCYVLKAISNLTPCVSLRELSLSGSTSVVDLQGLEKMIALETLNLVNMRLTDFSILRQCANLVAVSASSFTASADQIQTIVDAAACCLIDYFGGRFADAPPGVLSCMRRCTVLRSLKLHHLTIDSASLQGLAEIPTLRRLALTHSHVSDLTWLANCGSLRELKLAYSSPMNGVSLVGLELISTLEKLDLTHCAQITSVGELRNCVALSELVLRYTRVTAAGIVGLERVATLTTLTLDGCRCVTSVSSLRHSPSLRNLDISRTPVTTAGISGLEEIGTLERLEAIYCVGLEDVMALGSCRALRVLDLSNSGVRSGIAALAGLTTLETLKLRCHHIRDVSSLSGSVSLRELDLGCSSVDDAGIAGLERIATLTTLELGGCQHITNVTHLAQSKSLRRLALSHSSVTNEGLVDIETSPALEFIELFSMGRLVDAGGLALTRRAAKRAVAVIGRG